MEYNSRRDMKPKNKTMATTSTTPNQNKPNDISYVKPGSEFLNLAFAETNNLIITNNLVSNEDWDSIINHLNNSLIQTVELSGINISGYGLRGLSDILQRKNIVKTLKLEWNYMSEIPDDFDYFCEIMCNTSSLINIYLNNNKIGCKEAKSVAKFIKNSKSIAFCDLRWNEIGNEGVVFIIDALKQNTSSTMQDLNLMGNKISNEALAEVGDLINKNKTGRNNNSNNNYLSSKSPKASNLKKKDEKSTKSFDDCNKYNNMDMEKEYTQTQMHENSLLRTPNNIIEKEKEISDEFKARYDVQLIANSKLEKRVKELEVQLSNEKAKFEEFKMENSKDLDFERNTKMKYEDMILNLKDDLMRKDLEINMLNKEFNSKLQEEIQIKNDCINDNKLLNDKLENLNKKYEEKYKTLDENYKKNTHNLIINYDNLRLENEQLRREHNEFGKMSTGDFEKKLMSFEESYKQLNYKKEETDKENFHLKKEIMAMKMSREIENKERESKILEEENRKFESVLKNFEQKLKMLESTRADSITKNQNQQEEFYKLRKNFTEKENELENKINTIISEKSSLQKSNSLLTSDNKKLQADISIKESQIHKFKNDVNEIFKNNDSLSSYYNEKIEEAKSNYFSERKVWEREKNELKNLVEDQTKQIETLKFKITKMESDDVKNAENMKKAFTKLIENNFKDKQKI